MYSDNKVAEEPVSVSDNELQTLDDLDIDALLQPEGRHYMQNVQLVSASHNLQRESSVEGHWRQLMTLWNSDPENNMQQQPSVLSNVSLTLSNSTVPWLSGKKVSYI